VQVFYALEDMRSPVLISIACIVLNLGFGTALLKYEVVGLAAAFTLSSFAQMGLLLILLRRKVGKIGARALLKSTVRQLLNATTACGLAWAICLMGDWSQGPTLSNAVIMLGGVLTAIATYAGLEFYFGSQEAQKIWALVKEKIGNR